MFAMLLTEGGWRRDWFSIIQNVRPGFFTSPTRRHQEGQMAPGSTKLTWPLPGLHVGRKNPYLSFKIFYPSAECVVGFGVWGAGHWGPQRLGETSLGEYSRTALRIHVGPGITVFTFRSKFGSKLTQPPAAMRASSIYNIGGPSSQGLAKRIIRVCVSGFGVHFNKVLINWYQTVGSCSLSRTWLPLVCFPKMDYFETKTNGPRFDFFFFFSCPTLAILVLSVALG
jgi:hypothetical protein